MTIQAYKVIRSDRAAEKALRSGVTVFDCTGHDYGCANDDTRMKGIRHISVTLASDGGYPFFTIPEADLERFTHDPSIEV